MRSRRVLLAVLVVASLLSSGCLVVSLQPFYDGGSIEFDETLVGTWENPDEKNVIRVDRGEWKSYKVTYPARSGPVVFTGYLTRVGDGRVLDLTLGRSTDPATLLIPAHLAVRLQLLGDALTMTGLDYDWFLRETEQGRLPQLAPVLDARKDVVLTAETAALRSWIAAQTRSGNMFADEVRLVRKPY